MGYNPQKHHRRSIRLKGYDYAKEGAYFVTICTHHMECVFGKVEHEKMILNEFGNIAYQEWLNLALRFSNFEMDVFQIMPNHMHAIVVLNNSPVGAGFTPAPSSFKEKNIQTELLKEIAESNSTEIAESNSTEIDESNSTEIAESNSTEIAESNSTEIAESNSTEIAESNSTEIAESNSKEIAESNSTEITESNEKENAESHSIEFSTEITAGKSSQNIDYNSIEFVNVNSSKSIKNNSTDIFGIKNTIIPTIANLGNLIGAYKSLVAKQCLDIHKQKNAILGGAGVNIGLSIGAGVNPAPTILGKIWQRNYYEHIIRNERAYQNISNYIINNPAKWKGDK